MTPPAGAVFPVYAYTGEKIAGMTGSEYMVAVLPSSCTGLLPGSLGRVPVA